MICRGGAKTQGYSILTSLCASASPRFFQYMLVVIFLKTKALKKISPSFFLAFWLFLILLDACNKESDKPKGTIQLASIKIGSNNLNLEEANPDMPIDQPLIFAFNNQIDTNSAKNNIRLENSNNIISSKLNFSSDLKTITLTPDAVLENSAAYIIIITSALKGFSGETFPGLEVDFATEPGLLKVVSAFLNGSNFNLNNNPKDVDRESILIEVTFSHPLDPADYKSYFSLSGHPDIALDLSSDQKTVTLTNEEALSGYQKYYLNITSDLNSQSGFKFNGFYNYFYTSLDSTLKFPLISDEELLDLVQQQTFKYFYDFAHPVSGMARERNTSGDVVTTGGSGFGIMALIVGMERGFITRAQGLERIDRILDFLETCDRFHGAWPHWLNGSTGIVYPFSTKDNGADLVETSFLIQGLITMKQYLQPTIMEEDELIVRMNTLIDGVEWDWFTRGGQDVLYWHWSPNYGWDINMRLEGYNETMIAYVLAASSTTHTIPASAYHKGYARNGGIINGKYFYGYKLPLGWDYGGPLFFTHYSHLGLDPRNLTDQYASYWEQGVNMSLINWAYCVDNPKNWIGYREDSWGLTASDNPWGYNAHSPTNDLGVITPTAAVSAVPYTPEQSMNAIRHFYFILGDKLWGEYGFYDAFDVTEGWWASSYIAIDQGPIICMIENHRSGLLWDLFMSAPEIKPGLDKLDFSY
jgi:hypothetical protein